MARTIKQIPPRKTRYPWEKWTNGATWKARRGSDFDSGPSEFRRYVILVGRRLGIPVTTRVDGDVVVFQFSPRAAGTTK